MGYPEKCRFVTMWVSAPEAAWLCLQVSSARLSNLNGITWCRFFFPFLNLPSQRRKQHRLLAQLCPAVGPLSNVVQIRDSSHRSYPYGPPATQTLPCKPTTADFSEVSFQLLCFCYLLPFLLVCGLGVV